MITLENVTKNRNILSANYHYQDKNDLGYVEYNINTGKIIKYIRNKEDEKYESNMGSGKSRQAFELMVKYNKFPENFDYIWY